LRRIIGYILIGLGVFAVALGLMLRLYAYPRLAKAPLDPNAISVANGSGITALEIIETNGVPVPQINRDLTLTATRKVVGDLAQPEVKDGGNVASWIETVDTVDQNGNRVKATERQLCVDRHSNEAVEPCLNRHVIATTDPETYEKITEKDVAQPGVSLKFPFDTEKRNYPFYDLTIRSAPDAKFEAEEEIDGLNTYRFIQDIPATKVEARKVPGSLVGKSDTPMVDADLYYQVKRTIWVEPATGQVIKGQEVQHQELVQSDQTPGQGTVVFDGTLTFNDETVAKNVKDAKDNRGKLWLLTVLPIILWIAGTLFIIGGVALLLLRRRGGRVPDETPPQMRQLTGAST
jgi:hypothetical protein